jgi:hypothetical protein
MIDVSDLFGGPVLWQMSAAERAAVLHLLARMPAKRAAIEVGSFKGGLTRVLSGQFAEVYSLDIDHTAIVGRDDLANVAWVTGDSARTLPQLVEQLNSSGQGADLVVIDGDHSFRAVRADIEAVLRLEPLRPIVVLIHDSWMPETRDAISTAPWSDCQHVHLVEKDLVPGDAMLGATGPVLVGGLAFALLAPEVRTGRLEISQRHDYIWRLFHEVWP